VRNQISTESALKTFRINRSARQTASQRCARKPSVSAEFQPACVHGFAEKISHLLLLRENDRGEPTTERGKGLDRGLDS